MVILSSDAEQPAAFGWSLEPAEGALAQLSLFPLASSSSSDGDLAKQAVQRFETFDDLDAAQVTIEEREVRGLTLPCPLSLSCTLALLPRKGGCRLRSRRYSSLHE